MGERLFNPGFILFACLLPGSFAYGQTFDILVENAAAPWSKPDGTGYANDIVIAAFAAAGGEAKLSVVPYVRCKAMVVAGLAPACFSMSPEPGLSDTVVLADMPLFRMHSKFFYNVMTPKKAASENELQPGMVVGLVNGYEYPERIRNLKARGIVIELSNSELINLRKLSVQRLDFAVVNLDSMKVDADLLREAGINNVAFAFDGGSLGAYIGFSKQHALGASARRMFNEGYAQIVRNGTLEKIRQRWEPQAAKRKN